MWFRRDLRLGDNPALCAAGASAGTVLPLFVLDERLAGVSEVRHHRLAASLSALWRDTEGALVIRSGNPEEIVADLAAEVDRWVYVGDSTNDQVMFQHLPQSVGVANIRRFEAELRHKPRYITQGERGAGFAEMARALLADRRL